MDKRNIHNTSIGFSLLIAGLAAAALFVAILLMPTPSILIAFGREEGLNEHGEAKNLYSFLGWGGSEIAGGKNARRATEVARFAIPWAFRLGQPLKVTCIMSTWGVTQPIQLRMNDMVVSLPADDSGWRTYHFLLYDQSVIYERDLYMEWQSVLSTGPLLHQVMLQPIKTDGWLSGPLLVGLCVAVIVVLGIGARNLAHPSSLFQHSSIPWIIILITSAILSRWLYEPQRLSWSMIIGLGGGSAIVLTVMIPHMGKRLGMWGIVLWVLATPHILGTWILDDAFISFRYAKNLINGIGLTFNVGERVEGYTNFLWTMIIAGCMAIGFEPVVTTQFLCTSLALAILFLCYHFAATWWPNGIWALFPPMLLSVCPPFLLYTARGSGMETALVTLLVLTACWFLWKAHHFTSGFLAGVVCAWTMMTRPDGLFVPISGIIVMMCTLVSNQCHSDDRAFLSLAWFPLLKQRVVSFVSCLAINQDTDQRSSKQVAQSLIGVVCGLLIFYAPYFIWRYSYYGYLLPNTFYAKVGATLPQLIRGFTYAYTFIHTLGAIPLLVLALFSVVGCIQKRSIVSLLWLFVLLTLAYSISVGGDQFPLGRFFIAALPPLALIVTHGLVSAWESSRLENRSIQKIVPLIAIVSFAVLILHNVTRLPESDSRVPGPIWSHDKVAMKNADAGYWFLLNTPPDTVIATGMAGALPYYSNRFVINMLGLNDTHIAHLDVETMGQGIAGAEKTDMLYVLSRKPNYIPWTTIGHLDKLEQFQQEYRRIRVLGPKGGFMRLYERYTYEE